MVSACAPLSTHTESTACGFVTVRATSAATVVTVQTIFIHYCSAIFFKIAQFRRPRLPRMCRNLWKNTAPPEKETHGFANCFTVQRNDIVETSCILRLENAKQRKTQAGKNDGSDRFSYRMGRQWQQFATIATNTQKQQVAMNAILRNEQQMQLLVTNANLAINAILCN